ncbi:MAG: amidohydrolase family protein [Treponema sp.]|jgi:guanine deaminase|nr:amidohydrolase family protein [Treponema sp.]
MDGRNFILKGDICYSKTRTSLATAEQSFLVCAEGKSAGVFSQVSQIPLPYRAFPYIDHTGKLIIPGLVDLHIHAPQFAFRSLGMDLELLDWLETRAFPEEAKYQDTGYALRAYTALVKDLQQGPNTRICLFGTVHVPATLLLMELLENSGLVCMAGKVNMDRNSPDTLREQDAACSVAATREWLERCGTYTRCKPILTPRFIPSCTDELLRGLSEIQQQYNLPLQSHLSENLKEIAWVQALCPQSSCYGDAYTRFNLFGGPVPTIMAHCVYSGNEEIALMQRQGVHVAHCPQSNMNLSSGIAPVRRYLEAGLSVGLGSDVAGGAHTSMFRAMTDAIGVSKLRRCTGTGAEAPLTLEEVFYLGTQGGGSFFGQVGSFEAGYEFDALVMEDPHPVPPFPLSLRERLERIVGCSDERDILEKYVQGILLPR